MIRRTFVSALLVAFALASTTVCSPAELAGSGVAPADGATQAPVRVLFIGNSYTYFNNMPGMVQQLARAAARPVEAHTVAYGGATLARHWNEGEGPARIRSQQWDYVVLQEQSTRPIGEPEAFFEYARLFDELIRSRGAETVLYMTWAREANPDSQAQLTSAYETIGRELGAKVAPVGRAWAAVREQTSATRLFDEDGSHPNAAGSYLAACVLYATLLGADPRGASVVLNDPENGSELVRLSDDEASRLQAVAWRTASR